MGKDYVAMVIPTKILTKYQLNILPIIVKKFKIF